MKEKNLKKREAGRRGGRCRGRGAGGSDGHIY